MTKLQWFAVGSLTVGVAAVYMIVCLLLTTYKPEPAIEPIQEPQAAAVTIIPVVASAVPTATRSTPATPQITGGITVGPKLSPTPTPTPVGAVHFLSDYLRNRTYPNIVEARPWTHSSLNVWQYSEPLGGVTFWDYFATQFGQGFDEDWNSERHGWRDDDGQWQSYQTESLRDERGQPVVSYVIVDRRGTGVVDKMVFTLYSVGARPGDRNPDLSEWGYLSHLGRLRIEVDEQVAYDVPIEEWFSGAALCLPPDLSKLFFWRYRDFGSNGSVIPIPYQRHIKISTYGGTEQPKWFMFTGATLPEGTAVQPLSGCLDPQTQNTLAAFAPNIVSPENYLDRLNQPVETREWNLPSRLALDGAGTLTALQFRVPKNKAADISLAVTYGNGPALDLPLMAFFSDQDRLVQHRSTPIGVVDDPTDPNRYLFYCNYPLPYQNGITIELRTRSQPVTVRARYARSDEVTKTQLRVLYDNFQNHAMMPSLGADYTVQLPGQGKLVGLVLATRDHRFDAKAIPAPPAELVSGTSVFPLGYMESNVTLQDGRGVVRVYSGLEDFADGGYDFDSDRGPGAKNLAFAGVLAFSLTPRERGYFTLFRYWNDLSAFRFRDGLSLSFQHGTWDNNFSLRYGVTAFYYAEIP